MRGLETSIAKPLGNCLRLHPLLTETIYLSHVTHHKWEKSPRQCVPIRDQGKISLNFHKIIEPKVVSLQYTLCRVNFKIVSVIVLARTLVATNHKYALDK